MTTIVFLHAHPDDEASATAGSMARAAARGDRVVLVYATGGEHGTAPEQLAPGQSVADFRRGEALHSAGVIGIQRVEWLGYHDSGMTGWDQNGDGLAFANADDAAAGRRLADIIDDEDADVVVGYDWHGSYGHPDHVKVHPVAKSAVAQANRAPRYLESTQSRDHMRALYQRAVDAGAVLDDEFNPDNPADDGNPFGEPESDITFKVDVRDLIETKRSALACHASQPDAQGMLQMPEVIFREGFGFEWYIEPGAPKGLREVYLPWE